MVPTQPKPLASLVNTKAQSIIILFFNRVSQLPLGIGTDKTEPEKPFINGVSYLFTLKLAFQAKVSVDAIV